MPHKDDAGEYILFDISEHSVLFDKIQNGVAITDSTAKYLYVNPAFTKITGYTSEEALGQSPGMLHSGRHNKQFYMDMWRSITTKGYWEGEIWNRKKSGTIYPEFLTISKMPAQTSDQFYYIAIFSDISFLKKDTEQNMHLAFYDPLTELPNRALYMNRLRHEISISNQMSNDKRIAVFFMDLDKFKQVNDTHGHIVGDELLKLVGMRLTSVLRAGDTVARIGGDEFAVLLTSIADKAVVLKFAQRIVEVLEKPFVVDKITLNISISVGIAFYPTDSTDVIALLDKADKAMYFAKKNQTRVCCFDDLIAAD